MKKVFGIIFILMLMALMGCQSKDPSQPELNITKSDLALMKYVAVGNSLTAGFQSGGLVQDFQMHSFPYYIAKQIGKEADFAQPLVNNPGIGSTPGMTPLYLDTEGNITSDSLTVSPIDLLLYARFPRPYNNLGVPGATLHDVLNATDATTSQTPGNSFFDVVLRGANFGSMTQLEQTALLQPTLLTLWIGNNDILGSVTSYGGDANYITPVNTFTDEYTTTLTRFRQETQAAIFVANIPSITDIPFVTTLNSIMHASSLKGGAVVPCVFDANLQPIDFGNGLYLPLLTEETDISHVLLPELSAYSTSGLGIPDSAALVGMGLDAGTAGALVAGMQAQGLVTSGQTIPGTLTITADEAANVATTVAAYNAAITGIVDQINQAAGTPSIFVVDMNGLLAELNESGIDGLSGHFVLVDPAHTAFSLDGVHPNNAGYALVANKFIQSINAVLGLQIPEVDASQYAGQYVSVGKTAQISMKDIQNAVKIFQ